MTVEEKIQSILAADLSLVAEVPASKIRPPGHWQETLPFIRHFEVTREPLRTLDAGLVDHCARLYQISVFAGTYSSGAEIAALARQALDGIHTDSPLTWVVTAHYQDQHYFRESDVDAHHFALEFRVFAKL